MSFGITPTNSSDLVHQVQNHEKKGSSSSSKKHESPDKETQRKKTERVANEALCVASEVSSVPPRPPRKTPAPTVPHLDLNSLSSSSSQDPPTRQDSATRLTPQTPTSADIRKHRMALPLASPNKTPTTPVRDPSSETSSSSSISNVIFQKEVKPRQEMFSPRSNLLPKKAELDVLNCALDLPLGKVQFSEQEPPIDSPGSQSPARYSSISSLLDSPRCASQSVTPRSASSLPGNVLISSLPDSPRCAPQNVTPRSASNKSSFPLNILNLLSLDLSSSRNSRNSPRSPKNSPSKFSPTSSGHSPSTHSPSSPGHSPSTHSSSSPGHSPSTHSSSPPGYSLLASQPKRSSLNSPKERVFLKDESRDLIPPLDEQQSFAASLARTGDEISDELTSSSTSSSSSSREPRATSPHGLIDKLKFLGRRKSEENSLPKFSAKHLLVQEQGMLYIDRVLCLTYLIDRLNRPGEKPDFKLKKTPDRIWKQTRPLILQDNVNAQLPDKCPEELKDSFKQIRDYFLIEGSYPETLTSIILPKDDQLFRGWNNLKEFTINGKLFSRECDERWDETKTNELSELPESVQALLKNFFCHLAASDYPFKGSHIEALNRLLTKNYMKEDCDLWKLVYLSGFGGHAKLDSYLRFHALETFFNFPYACKPLPESEYDEKRLKNPSLPPLLRIKVSATEAIVYRRKAYQVFKGVPPNCWSAPDSPFSSGHLSTSAIELDATSGPKTICEFYGEATFTLPLRGRIGEHIKTTTQIPTLIFTDDAAEEEQATFLRHTQECVYTN